MDQPVYRFAKVLAEYAEKHNYVALARAISEANGVAEGERDLIGRRKLKKIAENAAGVSLSIDEFDALDRFLEPRGYGLAFNSLFQRANMLQTVAEAGRGVTFLLGSKPVDEQRLGLDHWDVRAMAEVLRAVNRLAPSVQFDIRDVLLHDNQEDAMRSVTKGNWTKLLEDGGTSLIVAGSSRATHAAELLLARMFSMPPMADGPEKDRLPFHFVWPDGEKRHILPSSFGYTVQELARVDPESARRVAETSACALEVGGEVYLDRMGDQPGRHGYGVCVAQRRPGGQIWVVLAGVTGPATLAAARVADGLPLNLRASPGKASPVFWSVVRATLTRDTTRAKRLSLVVSDQTCLGAPHQWQGLAE